MHTWRCPGERALLPSLPSLDFRDSLRPRVASVFPALLIQGHTSLDFETRGHRGTEQW